VNPPERQRRESSGRRENDEVLAYRVDAIEKQVAVFAPSATQLGLHEYQLHENGKRMDDLETGLRATRKEARDAAADLLSLVNDMKVKLEGMSVRLALIVGVGSVLGGGIVTLVVALLTT